VGGIYLNISHVNIEVIFKSVWSYVIRVEAVAEHCIEIKQHQWSRVRELQAGQPHCHPGKNGGATHSGGHH